MQHFDPLPSLEVSERVLVLQVRLLTQRERITKPISLATKAGGKGAAEILGVTTGAKKEAIQILANPNTSRAAKDAMRGRFTDSDIIKLAEGQFEQLKKARNDRFKADTKDFDLKAVKVEPNLVDNLLNITDDIRVDRGIKLQE